MKTITFIFLLAAAAAPADTLAARVLSPLEEKVRYENALERKVEELLLKVLGPGQARVTVEAALKVEETFPGAKKKEGGESQFAFLNAAQRKEKMKELLPGYSAPIQAAPMSEDEAGSFSYKVARLNVTIVASGEIPPASAAGLNDLVSRVLALDPARGDTVDLVRAQFAPVWKQIWYSPEYMGYFVRYGVIAVVIIISFLIIGMGIMRLAGAMGRMASAQEISIGFNEGREGGLPPGQSALAGPATAGAAGGEKKELAGPDEEAAGRLVFNVRREHIPVLFNMLKTEAPENIALVVYHLPGEIRGELLAMLGRELASRVVLNLASVRFVDREIIAEMKEELERRLESAIGGIDKAIEIISPMRYTQRKELILQFGKYNPELAREIRKVMVLDDDLLALDDNAIGALALSIPVAQWGEVLPGLQEGLRGRIKAALPEKSVALIEQTMKFSAGTPEKRDEALEKFMEVVAGLIKSGRLPRPAADVKMIGAAAVPGKAADKAPEAA